MEHATNEAYNLITEFTTVPAEQEVIKIFLSEAPIGNEYNVLTEEEWELGIRYELWLKGRGVAPFRDYTFTEAMAEIETERLKTKPPA